MSKYKNPYKDISRVEYARIPHHIDMSEPKKKKGKGIFREILEGGAKEGMGIAKDTVSMAFKDL